jgi:hypothetical protein
MTNNSHQNSRQVTIFRAATFVQNAQTGNKGADSKSNNESVQDWIDLASKHIGPYLQSNSSKSVGSGLNISEVNLLLPHLINIESDDRDFKKGVEEYFNNLVTKIPPTTGKTFEIGLYTDNTKPLSEKNLPIDIEDYVRYRHAKSHPWVAASQTEAEGNPLKHFYMNDPEAELKFINDTIVLQDKADAIWATIKSQPAKITMMLTLLGKDEREYVGRNSTALMIKDLHYIVKNKATAFLKAYEGEKFETRYWLKAMLKAAVVTEIGTSFVATQNNKLLARSEEEMLLFLEDAANADTVMFLKSATQDILRKPKEKKTATSK